MKRLQYILLCGLLLLAVACEKDTLPMNFSPALTTGAASDIYRVGATLSGTIQKSEGVVVQDYGILISELQSMAEYTEIKTTSTESTFDVMVQNLEPGKKYYYCAYANSGYNIARGEIKEFSTTDSNAPIFSELAVENKDEKSITVSTTILDEGGSELILCGFCWRLSEEGAAEPTVEDNVSNVTVQSVAISARIKDLKPNKNYMVRAYGINAKGVGYGKTITVSTNNATAPVVSSITPMDSTALSVSVKASILSEGESGISEIGFCWSAESQEPTTSHLKYDATAQLGHSEFKTRIEGLKAETTYYIRAYAINEQGIGYGDIYVFTTGKGLTVTTLSVEVNGINIKAYGQVTPGTENYHHGFDVASNMEDLINRAGDVISVDVYTNMSYNKEDGTFNSDIFNLKVNTTYYIRAWFIDSTIQDVIFGNVIEFTTGDVPGIYSLQDLMDFRDAKNSGGDLSKWKDSEGVINIFTDIDLSSIQTWTAIEELSRDETLDGNGHEISNLRKLIASNSATGAGFVMLNVGTIRNLTISGEIELSENLTEFGTFCRLNSGVIYDCVSNVNISSTTTNSFCGGICYNNADNLGYRIATIEKSINNGNVKSAGMAAGIAAMSGGKLHFYGCIKDCVNKGAIEGSLSKESYSGGIVASSVGVISDCINQGKVTGYNVGGISGFQGDWNITNCVNQGDVDGAIAGGIAGCVARALNAGGVEIKGNGNSGNIKGNYAGGICGNARGSDITLVDNTYDGGTVNGIAGTEANAIGLDERNSDGGIIEIE